MFCVECGKEKEIYKNGECIECYVKSHSFTEAPEIIHLPICTNCGSFKYKNTWTDQLLNEVIIRIVKSTFKIKKELKKIDINPVCKETQKGYDCVVYISGFIDKTEVTEKHNLEVRLKKTVCDVCSKRFGGYHEAIIQIRTNDRKLSNEEKENIIQNVINQTQNMQSKGNRSLFITDIKKEHGGITFFISDNQAAETILKKIEGEYGGNTKKSSKNVGMKDSKQIYRMTYLLRLPNYKKDDYIKFENNYYKINSVNSNNVKLLNLSNWEEESVSPKKLESIKTLADKEKIKEMIIVSQTKDEIQLMDTETYNTIQIKKPKKIELKYDKINVINIKNQFFLIPKKTKSNK